MVMKKKILVACGTGIATSTAVATKIEEIFKQKGIADKVSFSICKVLELEAKASDFDLIITTVKTELQLPTKVVMGVPFLINRGTEPIIQEIIEYLSL
jgi:PTS system galactitol-specific IIB component